MCCVGKLCVTLSFKYGLKTQFLRKPIANCVGQTDVNKYPILYEYIIENDGIQFVYL